MTAWPGNSSKVLPKAKALCRTYQEVHLTLAMHPTLVLQCFEWHFKWAVSKFPTLRCRSGVTRFATQGFAPGPGVKAAGDVGAPHCPTERGPMAAQVLALRFQAQLWAGILPTLPCSPCHGAGPGWLSEPAGSEHSERGSCPAAASSSCTLGHSSDTALTQPRHSTNTVRYNLDPALT